nr:diguanylate cyclase [Motilibacter aurantiacus]
MDQPWFFLDVLSGVIAVSTGVLAWRHRGETTAATALAVTMFSLAWWASAESVCRTGAPFPAQWVAQSLLFAGVGGVVVGFFCLSRAVAHPGWRPSRRLLVLLCLEPLLTVAAALTNPLHDWFYEAAYLSGLPPTLHRQFGVLYALHASYSYLLLLGSLTVLARALPKAHPAFRRQLASLLVAALVPALGNVPTVLFETQVDHTTLLFAVTGLVSANAVLRQGLLSLVPIARDLMVETMDDAILVVDRAGRVVDINQAGLRLLRRLRPQAPEQVVGGCVDVLIGPGFMRTVQDGPRAQLVEARPGLFIEHRTVTLHDRRDEVLGYLIVSRDVSENQRQRAALEQANQRLTEQLAVIEQLRDQLAEDASRDALTGLHNRRHLMSALDAALAEGHGAGRPVAVVLLDVDHFKRVNDTYGHAAGDLALQTLSEALRRETRAGDTVARLGGEEFVLVLPDVGVEQALQRAESLRSACARARVDVEGARLALTVSAGVAVSPDHASGATRLLAAADRGLYEAKRDGRNRVVVASCMAARS